MSAPYMGDDPHCKMLEKLDKRLSEFKDDSQFPFRVSFFSFSPSGFVILSFLFNLVVPAFPNRFWFEKGEMATVGVNHTV